MHKKSGFTIIEVVLVLAIAGLIFLMVFVALPNLRASQRDAQRRNDMAIISAALREYQKHNHGKMPPETEYQCIDGACSHVGIGTEHDFAKYLVDLSAGNVTEHISISDLSKYDSKRSTVYSQFGSTNPGSWYGYVFVSYGAKCPENGIGVSGEKNVYILTNKISDVAILRYMEKGSWNCMDM